MFESFCCRLSLWASFLLLGVVGGGGSRGEGEFVDAVISLRKAHALNSAQNEGIPNTNNIYLF